MPTVKKKTFRTAPGRSCAAAKIAKNENSDTRDFWLGAFVWPGLMDLQNADGNEGNALLDRNIFLRNWPSRNHAAVLRIGPFNPKDTLDVDLQDSRTGTGYGTSGVAGLGSATFPKP